MGLCPEGPSLKKIMILYNLYFFLYYYTEPVFVNYLLIFPKNGPLPRSTLLGPYLQKIMILFKLYFFLCYYTDSGLRKLPLYFPEKRAPAQKTPRAHP